MRNIKQAIVEFMQEEEGLTVVEYAIAGGLIGLTVVTAFRLLGGRVGEIIMGLYNALAPAPAA